jgi:hypothetical protein
MCVVLLVLLYRHEEAKGLEATRGLRLDAARLGSCAADWRLRMHSAGASGVAARKQGSSETARGGEQLAATAELKEQAAVECLSRIGTRSRPRRKRREQVVTKAGALGSGVERRLVRRCYSLLGDRKLDRNWRGWRGLATLCCLDARESKTSGVGGAWMRSTTARPGWDLETDVGM